ncbi:MAG: C45 family autoproteolytic acyltransferase/hydrolase [Acidobacteria bacterium]|nr:C45 family autoproteolytic acyltransferase/hydrolase [Acidobacteriota bacterium]
MSRAKRLVVCGVLVGLTLGGGVLLVAQAPAHPGQAPEQTAQAATQRGQAPALRIQVPAQSTQAPPQPAWWTGHNAALPDYYVRPGYPLYEPHARYIGDLKGTWREMGIQYGQRAGDLVRLVFEGYYDQILTTVQDPARIVPDARLFGDYHSKLVPEAVEFMKGIADGAAPELAKSTYAQIGTPYEKVLIINMYFALRQVLGHQYTWTGAPRLAVSTYSVEARRARGEIDGACTGVVVIGRLDGATKDRTTIHGGTRDQVFFPQLYEVSYTTTPADPKAYRIWTIASAGEIGGQMVGNEQGVIVTGYAGGNAKEIWAYGLEWNVGDWYAASFAKTAEEAAAILTSGRRGVIEATGSTIVVPAWGINWMISDPKDARVVEIVPGRYAIRKIGDFGEENFLVCTNHCLATWSFDDKNQRTTVPMTDFGSEQGEYSGLSPSGTRYWTQFWNAKYNYGSIDREMVMEWYRGHYYIDKVGARHDQVWDKGHGWTPAHLKALTPCRHQSGYPDTMKGTSVDAKVGVAQDLAFYFTKGRPHDWIGPWDVLGLKYR